MMPATRRPASASTSETMPSGDSAPCRSRSMNTSGASPASDRRSSRRRRTSWRGRSPRCDRRCRSRAPECSSKSPVDGPAAARGSRSTPAAAPDRRTPARGRAMRRSARAARGPRAPRRAPRSAEPPSLVEREAARGHPAGRCDRVDVVAKHAQRTDGGCSIRWRKPQKPYGHSVFTPCASANGRAAG